MGLDSVVVTASAGGELELTWTDNSGQGSSSATDVLIAVVYSAEIAEFVQFNPAATRADATATLDIPNYLVGSLAEVWATFATEDGKMAAISNYVGSVTII